MPNFIKIDRKHMNTQDASINRKILQWITNGDVAYHHTFNKTRIKLSLNTLDG